ncbi:MAG: hypothetical protein NVS9B1_19150 [Candidatus Dormibacteraceae bacterium]
MDKTQLGRAGELALTLYGLVTSDGQLELFSPVADDDHVDLVAGLRGGLPALAIQVKTTDGLDANGLVQAVASYRHGEVREDPAFLYAVLLMEAVEVRVAWLVPSPEFNRLAYRNTVAGRDVLEFRAAPDGDDVFAIFRLDPKQLGPALVASIQAGPAKPEAWLLALGQGPARPGFRRQRSRPVVTPGGATRSNPPAGQDVNS